MTCLPPPELGPGQVTGMSTDAVLEYAVSALCLMAGGEQVP